MRRRRFFIDEDTTDAFLDAPTIRYKNGETLLERTERRQREGDETAASRQRAAGKPELPPLPPPVDH